VKERDAVQDLASVARRATSSVLGHVAKSSIAVPNDIVAQRATPGGKRRSTDWGELDSCNMKFRRISADAARPAHCIAHTK